MTLPKSAASVAVAALSYAATLNLPAPWGPLVAAAVALVAYLADHGKIAAALAPAAPPRGFARAEALACVVVVALTGAAMVGIDACGGAPLVPLTLPSFTQGQAALMAALQGVQWLEAHGVSPDSLAAARDAVQRKDVGAALDVVRKGLEANARAGVAVPPELVAAVTLAEGAIAADSFAQGMRALSHEADAGAP